MLEKYFTDCSCSLEVHLQLMVKAWDRALAGYVETEKLNIYKTSMKCVALIFYFPCDHLFKEFMPEKNCFVSPASGYLLSNSFIWTIPQRVRATPAACASWLWLSASKLLQKIKANRHCLWPVRTSSQCSPSNQLNRKIRSYYCKIIYLPC